jgi:hypothetical protein
LTRIDAETASRGAFTDSVGATLRYTLEGSHEAVVEMTDLGHIAVARITVQPVAMSPGTLTPAR